MVPRENSRRAPQDSGAKSPQRARTRYERDVYFRTLECQGDHHPLDLEINTEEQADIEKNKNYES